MNGLELCKYIFIDGRGTGNILTPATFSFLNSRRGPESENVPEIHFFFKYDSNLYNCVLKMKERVEL